MVSGGAGDGQSSQVQRRPTVSNGSSTDQGVVGNVPGQTPGTSGLISSSNNAGSDPNKRTLASIVGTSDATVVKCEPSSTRSRDDGAGNCNGGNQASTSTR